MNIKEAAALLSSMGGKARAKALPKKRRRQIARKAARARWGKLRRRKKERKP